jgi:hypothetical protein
MTSAVLIAPVVSVDDANAFCAELGWGPKTFSIPLTSGKDEVTHWAARVEVGPEEIAAIKTCTYITPDFSDGEDAFIHAQSVFAAWNLVYKANDDQQP